MRPPPEVSVVMAVYNGVGVLEGSIGSVLSQQGVDLEFIIVDDGSDDGTAAMLDDIAGSDSRMRIVRQRNQGLTRALIAGCAVARGEFVARQDCGDRSLPGRLQTELEVIRARADVALVSCGTRFVGPNGETLYETAIANGDATELLLAQDIGRIRGPAHHGSTLFRRDLYDRVGGYREQFHFAQDLDLWTRMVEHGRHFALADILYEASFALGSISSTQRARQIACAKVILECAGLRRAGKDEAPALARAASIVPDRTSAASRDRAAALYFVGVCLRSRSDPRARQYFRDALRANPLHLKSVLRLLVG